MPLHALVSVAKRLNASPHVPWLAGRLASQLG